MYGNHVRVRSQIFDYKTPQVKSSFMHKRAYGVNGGNSEIKEENIWEKY